MMVGKGLGCPVSVDRRKIACCCTWRLLLLVWSQHGDIGFFVSLDTNMDGLPEI